MVLEQLFKVKWIEKKEHAFYLSFFYTLIGVLSAALIFPSNIGMMSVAFTSILLIPSLAMLLRLEENVEIREKKLSFTQLFKDHKDIFRVYYFMFLGIFLAYGLITMVLPDYAVQKLFLPQLRVAGLHGFASTSSQLLGLLLNNLLVFTVCFILSFVYGAGSVLFLTWNASVWGVVILFIFKQDFNLSFDSFFELIKSNFVILPHMVTEALAYISAAIVGGVVSKAVLREKLFSKEFKHIVTDALIFLVIGLILVLIAGLIEHMVFL